MRVLTSCLLVSALVLSSEATQFTARRFKGPAKTVATAAKATPPQTLKMAATKAPAPAAAPAPGPTPEEMAQHHFTEAKKKMAAKVESHYEAEMIVDSPTKVPPGSKEVVAPGQMHEGADHSLVWGQVPAPAAPGPAAPVPAPAPSPYHGMSVEKMHPEVKHMDNETMTDDWGSEYGPKGPYGVHGPYQPMPKAAARRGIELCGALLVGIAFATL